MQRNEIRLVGGLLVAAALALATVSATAAQMQPTPAPGGMMGGNGVGQGARLMNGGLGGGAIDSLDAAKQAFAGYIDRTGNQDLVLDEVMQFQWNYYAIVKETSSGNGALELLADPRTGVVFPEMGPNMMWNTRYSPMATFGGGMGGFAPGGMMSGTWGPTAPTTQPTVTADQATQIAQQWLDQYQAGAATEAPDIFPGYYTVHITRDGRVNGMLSVNAYTGQVWFHTWHGTFLASAQA